MRMTLFTILICTIIFLGNYYVENGYEYYYSVEKGKVNKYLDELLQSINVDLTLCAEAGMMSD